MKLHNALRRISKRKNTLAEQHEYFRNPDFVNPPESYLENEVTAGRSKFLERHIRKYASTDSPILEIGCNIGRNLNHLYNAGFRNLTAMEINPNAVRLMKIHFPDMAANSRIFNTPVEEKIKTFADGEFHVVYTMAVLEHIHPRSEWIFGEMARIAKTHIITIEDEGRNTARIFPRNYRAVFESLGMKQVEEEQLTEAAGLDDRFFKRIFQKK